MASRTKRPATKRPAPVKPGKIARPISSRLIVVAESEDTIADPGDRDPCYITVSVTEEDGSPVTGLTKANFKVDAMIVGPGGALVNIVQVTAGRLPGFYLLHVVPIRRETWKKGWYIWAIAVARRRQQGQTLTKVLLD